MGLFMGLFWDNWGEVWASPTFHLSFLLKILFPPPNTFSEWNFFYLKNLLLKNKWLSLLGVNTFQSILSKECDFHPVCSASHANWAPKTLCGKSIYCQIFYSETVTFYCKVPNILIAKQRAFACTFEANKSWVINFQEKVLPLGWVWLCFNIETFLTMWLTLGFKWQFDGKEPCCNL